MFWEYEDVTSLALANVWHRKLRSSLAALAVAIGVAMLVTMLALSHGTLEEVAQRVETIDAELVVLPPKSSLIYSQGAALSDKRTPVDAGALMAQLDLFADLRRGTGAVVIAACSGDEYSGEGPQWGNGVFTYSVLECFKSYDADLNEDSKIQVSELRDYVTRRVRQLTQGGQNPTVRQDNLANDFVVGEPLEE